MIKSANIFQEIYYDTFYCQYFYILTLSNYIDGPFNKYLKLTNLKNPSTKINKSHENYCSLVIMKKLINDYNNSKNCNSCINYGGSLDNDKINFCTIDDLSILQSFFIENNYTINNDLTKILSNNYSYQNNFFSANKKFLFAIIYDL